MNIELIRSTSIDKNISFSKRLLSWFDIYGRKDLPWQHPRTAYRVWISEIMLQQTQVQTVIPYFERFMISFPDIQQLAGANEDSVLAHWSGLGYYTRARNIYKTAKIICDQFSGQFPNELEELLALPGIGRSTAAAIASQAFEKPSAILDGNVKRVLARYFMVNGNPLQRDVNKRLWDLACQCMPLQRCADYTQAIMDLGATCCTTRNPNCMHCPLQKTCLAYLNNEVASYPFKKIKKAIPVKHQQFLLLYNQENQIYLEKRPPVGLWGGLWCTPAIELDCDSIDYVYQKYGFKCIKSNKLLRFKHTFSHFHLYINAEALQVKPDNNYVAEPEGQWFTETQFSTLGLAKPISQIIKHFLSDSQQGAV